MNAVLNERLNAIAIKLGQLPHGGKTAFLKAEAVKLNMSVARLYKELEQVMIKPERKKRSDAGKTALSREDAQMISACILQAMRANNKKLGTVEETVKFLIANKEIDPTRVDKSTGEVITLSVSTITRALKQYRLHPEQLLRPEPVTHLRSLHPNHLWQIDASLCVLFYLPSEKKKNELALQVMREQEFYKNKPQNIAKIVKDRVWRYVVTDHTSGCIFVWYVMGGENSENLCEAFIQAIQPKKDRLKFPFCGVPKMVMLDPGSANTGFGFKNLCQQLGVEIIINKVGNPRAKGQVEQANNQIERDFEGKLAFIRVNSLSQLQAAANEWMLLFNSNKTHSRHGMARFQAWQKIQADELRIPPPADYCRELVLSRPVERVVAPDLTISFEGRTFELSGIQPIVQNADKIMVAKNPWKPFSAQIQRFDEHGKAYWLEVPERIVDTFGFPVNAAIVGQEYKAHADTAIQTHAKELEKLAMQADTLEQAAQNRKAKHLPFGGRIDPFAHQEKVLSESKTGYMPKRGTQMDYNKIDVHAAVLSEFELRKIMKQRIDEMGLDWATALQRLKDDYPDGAPESELETVFTNITRPKLNLISRTGTDG